jgi:hypothetical protein
MTHPPPEAFGPRGPLHPDKPTAPAAGGNGVQSAAPASRPYLIGLAVIVAVFGACLTVVVVVYNTRTHHNRELIGHLACQVQRLGGRPIDDAKCPPPAAHHRHPPASSSTSPAQPHPTTTKTAGPGTVIVVTPATPPSSRHPVHHRTPPTKPPTKHGHPPPPSSPPKPAPTRSPVCVKAVRLCVSVGTPPPRFRRHRP